MAPQQSDEPTGHESADSLIDDVIRDILNEAGHSTKTRAGGGDMASLIETALVSASGTAPKTSAIERLLLTQALATALADALAPALAEVLAPEIMKALEQSGPAQPSGQETASATGPARGRKKT